MPKVYNKHHKDAPPGAVYVGRPTKWGNPFAIGEDHPLHFKGDGTKPGDGYPMSRQDVIDFYQHWITQEGHGLLMDLSELRGKDLVCWCAPLPCHADILLRIANEPTED